MTEHRNLWFDAEHTHAAAGVFLQTPEGKVILQLRDDIPGIDNPGMITAFGGGAERHETPIQCALRELAEETGLKVQAETLRFLGSISKIDILGNRTACMFYLLAGIEPHSLAVTEGKPVVLSMSEIAADPRTTRFCREFAARIPAPRAAETLTLSERVNL